MFFISPTRWSSHFSIFNGTLETECTFEAIEPVFGLSRDISIVSRKTLLGVRYDDILCLCISIGSKRGRHLMPKGLNG
jgi:hypothetical protein